MVEVDGAYEALLAQYEELSFEVDKLKKELDQDPMEVLRGIEILPGSCVEITMRVGPDDTVWDVWVQGSLGSDVDPKEALRKALSQAERDMSPNE